MGQVAIYKCNKCDNEFEAREGGDELMNSEEWPKCGASIYLDRPIEWVDEEKGICICPHCGEKVKINR